MTAKTSLMGMTALTLAAGLAGAAPAFANGGDFFEELSASWSAANAEAGVPYFGVVRDTGGRLVGGVSIAATTANGSTFIVQTDNMGHYRIPGFAKSVDPKRVQITCSKEGYKLVQRDRRLLRGADNTPIETNCVLAPQEGSRTS